MPKFKNLEIAKDLSNDSRVSIKNSLFGLCCTATYTPTDSKLISKKIEYSQEDGGKLERALSAKADSRQQTFSNMGKLPEAHLGNYLLEMCYSADHEFVALRLFKFSQMLYQPVTDTCIFEDGDAETIIDCII